VCGAQIGVPILPIRRVARLNEQAQPAVATAAHSRDAENINSGIAEQFVHAVLVEQYASTASPDQAPQQAEATSSQLFWVTTLDGSGCVARPDVDTAEEMCGEQGAVWKRAALCDTERAHR
jgi:hypothetical protein